MPLTRAKSEQLATEANHIRDIIQSLDDVIALARVIDPLLEKAIAHIKEVRDEKYAKLELLSKLIDESCS